jgi:hypothetical protein
VRENGPAGGCGYGYSCVYTDAISWAAPNRPLPMIRDPRVVFDELFGVLKAGSTPAERAERLAEDRSILDWLMSSIARLQKTLGPADRSRLADYLEHVRRSNAASNRRRATAAASCGAPAVRSACPTPSASTSS